MIVRASARRESRIWEKGFDACFVAWERKSTHKLTTHTHTYTHTHSHAHAPHTDINNAFSAARAVVLPSFPSDKSTTGRPNLRPLITRTDVPSLFHGASTRSLPSPLRASAVSVPRVQLHLILYERAPPCHFPRSSANPFFLLPSLQHDSAHPPPTCPRTTISSPSNPPSRPTMASLRLTNRVLDLWKAKQPAVTAWMGIGSSLTAEALARQGFDACLVDMQHGMIDEGTAIQMFAAIATVPGSWWHFMCFTSHSSVLPRSSPLFLTSAGPGSPPSTLCPLLLPPFSPCSLGVTPLARVRCNQPDKIHFLLDAGALGIVCPLINTAQVRQEGGRDGRKEGGRRMTELLLHLIFPSVLRFFCSFSSCRRYAILWRRVATRHRDDEASDQAEGRSLPGR